MSDDERPTSRRVPRRAFVTAPELARVKGCTRATVWNAIQEGRLPGYRTPGNKTWQIPVEHARVFLGKAA